MWQIPHNPEKIEMILPLFAPSAITQPIIMTTKQLAVSAEVLAALSAAPRVPATAEVSAEIKSQFNIAAEVSVYRLEWDGIKVHTASDESLRNWDDLEDTEIPTTCPLCHHEEVCSHNGAPLIDGIVCDDCQNFVLYSRMFPNFKGNVESIKKDMPQIIKCGDGIHNGRADCVPLRVSTHLADLPEKHFLHYACGIECYFRAMMDYQKSQGLALCGVARVEGLVGTACSALSAAIKYHEQLNYPFALARDGSIFAAQEVIFTNGQRFAFMYKMKVVSNPTTTPAMFGITEAGKLDAPLNDDPNVFAFRLTEKGRVCEAVSGNGRVLKLTDDFMVNHEAEEERKARKQAQKEKELKEQQRKEKKEREREEMRQIAIKQREEEIALKAARATLIAATAVVDTQLETIRKVRELNREVAIKNQKIADRKEAERLAKDAEKRHAEKLKQKELERQKFITKKN